MGQTEQASETNRRRGVDRKRVEMVVEALAALRGQGESVSEVAHDARNMVTALGLYCDLLDEPGVLAPPYAHYASELRLVAAASRRLVEKIVALDTPNRRTAEPFAPPLFDWERGPGTPGDSPALPDRRATGPETGRPAPRGRHWDLLPAVPISNLAAELVANRNLLSALSGPSIALTIDVDGGARPVRLTGEDLTRVLVNLVKNAGEAMPDGGQIRIGLNERPATGGVEASLSLTVEDSGPGIPPEALETIFASGYTSHRRSGEAAEGWSSGHRGLGLAITRALIEGAGGRIRAGNRAEGGARFEIELPERRAGG